MTAPSERQRSTPQNPQQPAPPVPPPPVAPTSRSGKTRRASEKVNPLRRVAAHTSAPTKAVRDSITAAHATLALGGLEHVANVPMVFPGLFGAVLAGTGAWWGNRDHAEMGFGATVGASVGGWLMWSAAETPWSVSSLAALVIGATGLGSWYGKIRRRHRMIAQVDDQVEKATASAAGSEESRMGWQQILEKAGCKGVEVVSTEPLGGQASGFTVKGRLTSPQFDYKALSGMLGAIEVVADHHTEYPIRPGAIQLSRAKHSTAGQFVLSIPTVNIFGEKIPHPISHEPRSIEDPIEIATAADGTRLSVVHGESAHGMFSGMTDFGKSNLLNCHVFEWTRCVDAAVWLMSGSDKSAKLFKPLFRAWLKGEIPNPPIDRFAPNEEEAMYMLWDAKEGMSSRSKGSSIDDLSSKWKVTPDAPRIVIGIEEAGDFLASGKKWKMPDGSKPGWTFGQLLLEVIRKARSEAINLLLLLQGGTMDLTGDFGSAIKKQILYRVAFHAQSTTEINACLSTDTARVELGELDKGEIYVEQAGYKRPVLALADYMEDGSENNIMDRAARMHYQYARAVDDATAAAMPFYRDRWSRPGQQEYLASLMGMSVESITESPAAGSSQHGSGAEQEPSAADLDDDSDDPTEFSERMNALVDKYRAEVESSEVAELEKALETPPRSLGDLDGETLRVVGVLQRATENELTAADLRARVAEALGMEDTTETDRYVNSAIQDILGVDELPTSVKRRRTISGSKVYVWDMEAIRAAIRDMGR